MHESPEQRRERREREAEEHARHSKENTYTINVNVFYHHADEREHVPAWAQKITHQLGELMAVSQEMQDAIAKVDTETNALADRVAKIQATLANNASSAEDKAAALADLNALADRLKTIGADPANPVPPTP